MNKNTRITFGGIYRKLIGEIVNKPVSVTYKRVKNNIFNSVDIDGLDTHLAAKSMYLLGRMHKKNCSSQKMFDEIYMYQSGDSIENLTVEFVRSMNSTLPHKYISKMWIVKWSETNKLLFDYFVSALSTHKAAAHIDPYILCVTITLLIYRISNSILLIVRNDSGLRVPVNWNYVPLSKNTINKFMEDNQFTEYLSKMYGYYCKLLLSGKLDKIHDIMGSKLNHCFNFYRVQAVKNRALLTNKPQSILNKLYNKYLLQI